MMGLEVLIVPEFFSYHSFPVLTATIDLAGYVLGMLAFMKSEAGNYALATVTSQWFSFRINCSANCILKLALALVVSDSFPPLLLGNAMYMSIMS